MTTLDATSRRFARIGLLLAIASVACAAPHRILGVDPSGEGGSATASGGSGAGEGGAGGGACLAPSCSDDGKTLLCNGAPVGACDSGEVCKDGACVSAPCAATSDAQSTSGCAFWALHTDPSQYYEGDCFAAFITNTSDTPVHITLERAGASIDIESVAALPKGAGGSLQYSPYSAAAGVPPGEVAVLFLGGACPAGEGAAPGIVGTGYGNAFHIATDAPVVAYQAYPFGNGSAAYNSATLLLPTTTWDDNYVTISAFPVNQHPLETPESQAKPTLSILAAEDGTDVTINPVAAIAAGGGLPGGGAGQPMTFTLSKGQYAQITQAAELTGSALLATKPVAVFGGHTCLMVPSETGPCDTAHQQIPPVRAMGSEYVAVRYEGRNGQDEVVPWRLVGAVDGTTLSYAPSKPAGAPSTLARGQIAEFWSPGPFVVKSQDADHPFYLGAYMTAAGYGNFLGQGDPEWINVVPTTQLLSSYVFFTDPTYPATHVVVIRKMDDKGSFAAVNLDCAGDLAGWKPVGDYEYTRRDLVSGGCQNGRHTATSTAPFGVTVWGWAQSSSYAYPAGASVKPVNRVEVPPIP